MEYSVQAIYIWTTSNLTLPTRVNELLAISETHGTIFPFKNWRTVMGFNLVTSDLCLWLATRAFRCSGR